MDLDAGHYLILQPIDVLCALEMTRLTSDCDKEAIIEYLDLRHYLGFLVTMSKEGVSACVCWETAIRVSLPHLHRV